jgi:site-specific DNA-methyltransferase (adenine-specific)
MSLNKYLNKVIQGDCLELFKNIPDESIDVTFADPPFNLKKGYNSYKDSLKLQEYMHWCELWIKEMVRITKPTGIIFLHNIPKWLTYYSTILNNLAVFKHWISWDAPTAPMGKSLQPSHYGILFYVKDLKNFRYYEIRSPHKRTRSTGILAKDYGGKKSMLHPFGPLVSDVWTDIHRIKHNKFRDEHPCQLPIHLMERIILMSTDENDIILDPFMGTGTTAIAAKRLGRRFIGFELDKNYVDITNQKVSIEKSNSKLGESWVSFYLNEVITLRNKDWNEIKKYYIIPNRIEDIDKYQITLISKPYIKRPLKSNIVFESSSEYELFDEKKDLSLVSDKKLIKKKTTKKIIKHKKTA